MPTNNAPSPAAHAGPRLLPWRFILFLVLCAGAAPFALILPPHLAVMAGFDGAALVFLATLTPLFSHAQDEMRRHARANDANRAVMLLLTAIVMIVLLVVVAAELTQKNAATSWLTMTLILGTLAIAWTFSNMVYAMHYAFLFYSGDEVGQDRGGIDFPGTEKPDYWDFVYFAFTLGMTFQTSDVEIGSAEVRKTVTFHCLAAFVFNLGIIAFTINVLGAR
ncbi:MAG: DUF1345 domain-containing protein [Sphingobium sp.]